MAEKKFGRPKGSKKTTMNYCTVRLDKSLMGMLKALATRKGISSADWLSSEIRPILEKQYIDMLRLELEETIHQSFIPKKDTEDSPAVDS